jgi:hypothetical protein
MAVSVLELSCPVCWQLHRDANESVGIAISKDSNYEAGEELHTGRSNSVRNCSGIRLTVVATPIQISECPGAYWCVKLTTVTLSMRDHRSIITESNATDAVLGLGLEGVSCNPERMGITLGKRCGTARKAAKLQWNLFQG